MIECYNCHFQGHFLMFVSSVSGWLLQSLMSHIKLGFFWNPKVRTLKFLLLRNQSSQWCWGKACLIISVWRIIIQPVIQSRSNVPPQDVFQFRITTPSLWLKRENLDGFSPILFIFFFCQKQNILQPCISWARITNLSCHLTSNLHIICKWCLTGRRRKI